MGMGKETPGGDPASVCRYFFQNCFGGGTNPKYFFVLFYTEVCLMRNFEKVVKWLNDTISRSLLTEL